MITTEILIIAFLLCLNGFFALSEMAVVSASRPMLKQMMKQGVKGAELALRLAENSGKFLSTVQVGITLVGILAGTFGGASIAEKIAPILNEYPLIDPYGGVVSMALVVSIITYFSVVMGELIPKQIALSNPEKIACYVALPMVIVSSVCLPIVRLLEGSANIFLKLLGVDQTEEKMTEAEIRAVLTEGVASGVMVKDDKDRLGGLLDLRALDVSEVMIHRKDIVMLDMDMPAADLIHAMLSTPYTRLPIYQDNTENIIGVLHAKDVLKAISEHEKGVQGVDIAKIMRKPWYIPDTTSVPDQLNKFLSRRNHFAIVVDEYGAVQGLITLEDILEEIVGDIRDEHDIEIPGLRRQPDGSYVVDGKITIRDMNRKADWHLPDEEYTTIAGLVMHESRTIPERGQSFIFFGIKFDILERERNQIKKLRLMKIAKEMQIK